MEKAALLLELMKTRRSIRRFKSKRVPKTFVNIVLEAARWAPSAGNRQPWRFILIKNTNTRQKIGEIYQKIREVDLKEISTDSPRYELITERIKTDFYKNIFAKAPLLIVVCANPKESYNYRTYPMDCAVSIQNMLLLVHALGLGSTYIDFYRPEHESKLKQLKDLLEIPDDIEIRAILPLGYPDEEPVPPPRKDLRETVFQEKFEQLLH